MIGLSKTSICLGEISLPCLITGGYPPHGSIGSQTMFSMFDDCCWSHVLKNLEVSSLVPYMFVCIYIYYVLYIYIYSIYVCVVYIYIYLYLYLYSIIYIYIFACRCVCVCVFVHMSWSSHLPVPQRCWSKSGRREQKEISWLSDRS